ncbi:hypothetical protein TRFO_41817 [Tritrichomonas foetus]|uniref:Uncharacterized protein n=1 Tax=Tritrichomonas foetus TaxID=1144522 RepID=A0A1J4L3E2_9EUKA|nr:hypothetical protein TRFO_41817 [Tritrichomonas foetus]|eukprot:OHT16492.1 hypothetical protein TRFO_41817 [Tritrichomonas foetus]
MSSPESPWSPLPPPSQVPLGTSDIDRIPEPEPNRPTLSNTQAAADINSVDDLLNRDVRSNPLFGQPTGFRQPNLQPNPQVSNQMRNVNPEQSLPRQETGFTLNDDNADNQFGVEDWLD